MPTDLASMRIRVLPSEIQAKTAALLGAEPVKCDLTEAIAWIKAGTLDAQENPLANTVTYGVHKFHRFHTLTNHFYISRPIFLHRPSFDAAGLTANDARRCGPIAPHGPRRRRGGAYKRAISTTATD
jgi:TRAP-type C4-dicarboxylate transport system substrate-binding protein